jgi:hypothetical protein
MYKKTYTLGSLLDLNRRKYDLDLILDTFYLTAKTVCHDSVD